MFVVPIDCIVGDWGSWGPVNNEGIKTRARVRKQKPLNGGQPCPPLLEELEGKY